MTWCVAWPVSPRVMVGLGIVLLDRDSQAAWTPAMRACFSVVERATASPFEPAMITVLC